MTISHSELHAELASSSVTLARANIGLCALESRVRANSGIFTYDESTRACAVMLKQGLILTSLTRATSPASVIAGVGEHREHKKQVDYRGLCTTTSNPYITI